MATSGGTSSSGFHPTSKQIIGGVLAVLAIIFIAQNSQKGSIHFLFFRVTMPVWIAFLLLLLVGAVIGFVGRGIHQSRKAAKQAAQKDAAPPA